MIRFHVYWALYIITHALVHEGQALSCLTYVDHGTKYVISSPPRALVHGLLRKEPNMTHAHILNTYVAIKHGVSNILLYSAQKYNNQFKSNYQRTF